MQGILLIYLYYAADKGGSSIDKSLAGDTVSAYGGSVCLSTIPGAWFADRVWSAEKTLFISGVVVIFDHIALAIVSGLYGLLLDLVLIALGSGGMKPSASSMVGALYESGDMRPLCDAGFLILYISINIGGFLGPLLTGLLQTNLGFHYGFGAAAVGMAFGLRRYSRGRKNLPHPSVPNPLPQGQGRTVAAAGLLITAALGGVISAGWLTLDNFSMALLDTVIAVVTVYFIRLLTNPQVDTDNKRHIAAYISLFLTVCLFWSVWFQVYTIATVYFDETVDRTIGGFTIPVSQKGSMQSMWVVLFSGLMAAIWTKMGKRQSKTPSKFVLAMLVVGLSYLGFVSFVSSGTPMPISVFALVLLSVTVNGLMLSPIALSFSTKIAPPTFKTQVVALNFPGFSLGFTLGGMLFKIYYRADAPLNFFWLLCGAGMAGGAMSLLLVPVLSRMLRGVDQRPVGRLKNRLFRRPPSLSPSETTNSRKAV